MIAAAAAGSSPIGAGVGGPVPGATVVGIELDGGADDDDPVDAAFADVQAASTTTTASNGRPTPPSRLIMSPTMVRPAAARNARRVRGPADSPAVAARWRAV